MFSTQPGNATAGGTIPAVRVTVQDAIGTTITADNTIAAGAADRLASTIQPTDQMVGLALSPAVQVTVRDALGNRVPSASNAITIAIGTNPGGARSVARRW